jgi:hypothetical protein
VVVAGVTVAGVGVATGTTFVVVVFVVVVFVVVTGVDVGVWAKATPVKAVEISSPKLNFVMVFIIINSSKIKIDSF